MKLIPPELTSTTLERLPSYLETSVDVPPISNPIMELKLFISLIAVQPMTPPAGPDNIASLPVNESASVSPPELCINSITVSPNSSFKVET